MKNKRQLEKLYEEELKENEYLQNEIERLKYRNEAARKEFNEMCNKLSEINKELRELKDEINIQRKYTKHIQEYLCKDIFEMIKEEYKMENYYD